MTKKYIKFIKIGLILLTVIFLFSGPFCASSRTLEIEYPKLLEIQPEETSVPLPEYIEYIFNFAFWIVGIIALGMLTFAGIRYLSSTGNVSVQKDAKNQISSALIGIIILFLSVLVLNEINPELLTLSKLPDQQAPGFAFAQNNGDERKLEIDYPDIKGAKTPENVSTSLGEYVKYIFNFAVWIVGIVAFGVLIIAGTKYLVSIGNPGLRQDALNQILCAVLGILILVSSVIVLNKIKVDTATVNVSDTETASSSDSGIWLCKKIFSWDFEDFMKNLSGVSKEEKETKMKEVNKNCYKFLTQSTLTKEFNGENANNEGVKQVYIVNGENEYGLVMHQENDFKGGCMFATESREIFSDFKMHSGTPFLIKEEAKGDGVTIYDHRDFNEELEEGEPRKKEEIKKLEVNLVNMDPCYSIKVVEEEEWVAIAFGWQTLSPDEGLIPNIAASLDQVKPCEVFDKSDRNLEDDFIGTFCSGGFWSDRHPCIVSLRLYKGKIIKAGD